MELFTDIWGPPCPNKWLSCIYGPEQKEWAIFIRGDRAFLVELVQHEISLFAPNGRVFHPESPEFFTLSQHFAENKYRNGDMLKT